MFLVVKGLIIYIKGSTNLLENGNNEERGKIKGIGSSTTSSKRIKNMSISEWVKSEILSSHVRFCILEFFMRVLSPCQQNSKIIYTRKET